MRRKNRSLENSYKIVIFHSLAIVLLKLIRLLEVTARRN